MTPRSSYRATLAFLLLGASCLTPLHAEVDPEIEAAARSFVADHVSGWLQDDVVIAAVKDQNEAHAKLTQPDIDALDGRWREQSSQGGPLIAKVLGNTLSAYLKTIEQDSNGLITEVFVMDNRGLNVGQSSVTSDYWQGDEDKWQRSYSAGPGAVFIDEVELDESSQRFQTQVSVPVLDPESGKAIGAVTIGIDAEGLLMLL